MLRQSGSRTIRRLVTTTASSERKGVVSAVVQQQQQQRQLGMPLQLHYDALPTTTSSSTTLVSRSSAPFRETKLFSTSFSTTTFLLKSSKSTTSRSFATKAAEDLRGREDDEGPKEEEEPKKKSLKDAVNRMKNKKNEEGDGATSDDAASVNADDFLRKSAQMWSTFTEEVGKTWHELIRSGERKSINKKIHPEATAEGEMPYTGPVDIMIIDPSENLTAWERMQKRLTEAPIIEDMVNRAERLYEESGAKKTKEKFDHLREDAKEAWETSQNPWVYRVSSVYDTLTAETAESQAVKELRVLDPTFNLEEWRRDVVQHDLPTIMEWFLEGKINQLKPWLGEGVFKRIAAEITARKQEGVVIDTHVLGIMNSEILAVEPDLVDKGSPIILLHFMVQQINCTRKKEDGSVVEGAEDDIRANSYVAAFQREYDEEKGELKWKIVDFRFNGAIAYL